jgi:hypothetical protein
MAQRFDRSAHADLATYFISSSTPASTRHSLFDLAKKTLCAKGVQEKAGQSEFKTLKLHEALLKMLQLKKSY